MTTVLRLLMLCLALATAPLGGYRHGLEHLAPHIGHDASTSARDASTGLDTTAKACASCLAWATGSGALPAFAPLLALAPPTEAPVPLTLGVGLRRDTVDRPRARAPPTRL